MDNLKVVAFLGFLYGLPVIPVLINNLWINRGVSRSVQIWFSQIFISIGVLYLFGGVSDLINSITESVTLDCVMSGEAGSPCSSITGLVTDSIAEYNYLFLMAVGLVASYKFIVHLEKKKYLTSQSSR